MTRPTITPFYWVSSGRMKWNQTNAGTSVAEIGNAVCAAGLWWKSLQSPSIQLRQRKTINQKLTVQHIVSTPVCVHKRHLCLSSLITICSFRKPVGHDDAKWYDTLQVKYKSPCSALSTRWLCCSRLHCQWALPDPHSTPTVLTTEEAWHHCAAPTPVLCTAACPTDEIYISQGREAHSRGGSVSDGLYCSLPPSSART